MDKIDEKIRDLREPIVRNKDNYGKPSIERKLQITIRSPRIKQINEMCQREIQERICENEQGKGIFLGKYMRK